MAIRNAKAQYTNTFTRVIHHTDRNAERNIVDGEEYHPFGIRNFRVPMTERSLFAREAKRRDRGDQRDLAELDE